VTPPAGRVSKENLPKAAELREWHQDAAHDRKRPALTCRSQGALMLHCIIPSADVRLATA
jgi:hypothetical protein